MTEEHMFDTGDLIGADAEDPNPVEVTDSNDVSFVEPYVDATSVDEDGE